MDVNMIKEMIIDKVDFDVAELEKLDYRKKRQCLVKIKIANTVEETFKIITELFKYLYPTCETSSYDYTYRDSHHELNIMIPRTDSRYNNYFISFKLYYVKPSYPKTSIKITKIVVVAGWSTLLTLTNFDKDTLPTIDLPIGKIFKRVSDSRKNAEVRKNNKILEKTSTDFLNMQLISEIDELGLEYKTYQSLPNNFFFDCNLVGETMRVCLVVGTKTTQYQTLENDTRAEISFSTRKTRSFMTTTWEEAKKKLIGLSELSIIAKKPVTEN